MLTIRTPDDARELGTVLGLWAHPDDEAYLSGSLMALVRRASLAALDVGEHHWLGHADGTCADVPMAHAVADVLEVWRSVQPDTVVTFGPDGMTGHPDHQALWRWATAAWVATGRQARLLLATTTERFARDHADLHDRFDVFLVPGLPVRTPEEDLAVSIEPSDEVLDQKLAARRAQASQTAGLAQAFGEDRYRSWFARETFTDGAALTLRPRPRVAATTGS